MCWCFILACASSGCYHEYYRSQSEYVNELTQKLSNAGIRVKADLRNEKIGLKSARHFVSRPIYAGLW
ncbi:His/Gly/Thr/Pro-type tRNA ligase C-terminal domain-containing protein [Escherichia coli]